MQFIIIIFSFLKKILIKGINESLLKFSDHVFYPRIAWKAGILEIFYRRPCF